MFCKGLGCSHSYLQLLCNEVFCVVSSVCYSYTLYTYSACANATVSMLSYIPMTFFIFYRKLHYSHEVKNKQDLAQLLLHDCVCLLTSVTVKLPQYSA